MTNTWQTERIMREESQLRLTPMIDVTFLLLIFFMCSVKFKRLDGKLATYLPREAGVNAKEQFTDDLEHVVLYVEKDEKEAGRFSVSVDPKKRKLTFAELSRYLKAVRAADPDTKAACHAGKGVLHGQIVSVVNECIRSGIDEIVFKGIGFDD